MSGLRRPRVADAGVALLVVLTYGPTMPGAADPAWWAWLGATCLPLVWRRRSPVLVPCLTIGAGLASYAADVAGGGPAAAILVAVYTLARHRSWRFFLPPVAVTEAVLLYGLWARGLRWDDWVTLSSAMAAAILLGVTVRIRRAYLAALEERAERLERERDHRARLAVAEERARIAREVHDIVAHNLAVMVALSDGAAFTATMAPERAADTMGKVSAAGREALADMRRMLGLLRDGAPGGAEDLAPSPGLDDVDRLLDQVSEAGMRVTLIREGAPGDWGPAAGLTVYRIVQEALTNTIKHAGPHATAWIRLTYTATGADLEITDEGPTGPVTEPARSAAESARSATEPAERPPGGHGLAGMAERVASYGGRIEAGPRPGGGWRVHTFLRFGDGEAA